LSVTARVVFEYFAQLFSYITEACCCGCRGGKYIKERC